MSQTFKIQMDAHGLGIFIYNEDRTLGLETHTPEVVKTIQEKYGLEPLSKVFVTGDVVEDEIELGDQIDDQDW